jgi:hypothetical protein
MSKNTFVLIKNLIKEDMLYLQQYLDDILVQIQNNMGINDEEESKEVKYFKSIKNEYKLLKDSAIMISKYVSDLCEKNKNVVLCLFSIGICNTQLHNFKAKIELLHLMECVHHLFQKLEVHLQSVSTHLWQVVTLTIDYDDWSMKGEINAKVFGLAEDIKFQLKCGRQP